MTLSDLNYFPKTQLKCCTQLDLAFILLIHHHDWGLFYFYYFLRQFYNIALVLESMIFSLLSTRIIDMYHHTVLEE